MNVRELDLADAAGTYAIANSPLFLVRKLQDDPVIRNIAERFSSQEIIEGLRESTKLKPTTVIDAVCPYALLVALWFKPEVSSLEEAAGFLAPDFHWYGFAAAALLSTFSPVQTQNIWQGRQSAPAVTGWSPASTNRIIITP